MVLLTHISIALLSVAVATYLMWRPSRAGLRVSYGLVVAAMASGFYLALSNPAHITQTCLVGLMYVLAIGIATVVARNKLARRSSGE